MDVDGAHTGLRHEVHALLVQLDDFVQALHQDDESTHGGDGAIHDAAAATPHGHGNHVLIAQLHHRGDFLGASGSNHYIRQMEAALIRFFISFIFIQGFPIGVHILLAHDSTQAVDKFGRNFIVLSHNLSLSTFF